jgi:hypothetical protein
VIILNLKRRTVIIKLIVFIDKLRKSTRGSICWRKSMRSQTFLIERPFWWREKYFRLSKFYIKNHSIGKNWSKYNLLRFDLSLFPLHCLYFKIYFKLLFYGLY